QQRKTRREYSCGRGRIKLEEQVEARRRHGYSATDTFPGTAALSFLHAVGALIHRVLHLWVCGIDSGRGAIASIDVGPDSGAGVLQSAVILRATNDEIRVRFG